MAYIPTEWFSGDTITAEKLNNIEEGIKENDKAIDVWRELNSAGGKARDDLNGSHGPIVFYDIHGNAPNWTSVEEMLGVDEVTSGHYYLGLGVDKNFIFYSLDDMFMTSVCGLSETDFPSYVVAFNRLENRLNYITIENLAALIAEISPSPSPSPSPSEQ